MQSAHAAQSAQPLAGGGIRRIHPSPGLTGPPLRSPDGRRVNYSSIGPRVLLPLKETTL